MGLAASWPIPRPPVTAYAYGVALAGLASLVASARDLPLDRWHDLALFGVVGALAQLMPVRIFGRRSVSVAFAVTFASLVSFGAPAAVWVNLASGLVVCCRPRRKPLGKMALDVGAPTLSAYAAGALYAGLGGAAQPVAADWALLPPSILAITAYFLLSSGLLAAAIALSTHSAITSVWRDDYRWVAPNYVGLGLLGLGIAVAYRASGVLGLVAFVIPLAIAGYAFRLYAAEARMARRWREQVRLTGAMLSASPDLLLRLDRQGRVVAASSGDPALLPAPAEQLLGRPVGEVMPPAFADPILAQIARTLASRAMQTYEYAAALADGTVRDFEARLVVGGEDEVLAIVRDNTPRKELERQLAHQAFHDVLTGLPNRALFVDRLDHALVRAGRRHASVAVLFLDLDRFKVVNDSLGHDVGDNLLVAVAQRLRGCVRSGDTVARLGGDEFTVLLEDIAAAADAGQVAERIMAAMQAPFELAGHELCISASIGIAVSGGHGVRPDDLLRDADAALYRSKSRGKARYEVFDASMQARALERLRLENELRHGIDRGDLRVHYQPMVRLATGRIAAVEALVRWEHPERGFIPPGDFIPLAEESSLILPLSRWVLAEACRQASQWRGGGRDQPAIGVSVNLSLRQFQHPSLVDEVAAALHASGLEPRRLTLEITEGMMMEAAEAASAILGDLKALGVRLAIDDFGTGYSSLGYLKRFPIDQLKIDRSFVAGLGRDPEDTAIVHAVVRLAHTLGLEVTAEGIETAAQLEALRATGCEHGQGYYFARPLPAGAVERLFVLAPVA
ncbi:MAG TPA: EAL domain-containing protein [Chloroflexota bacterium]|nr:EAL domain-containing protein [Chloroflexota bacterium]